MEHRCAKCNSARIIPGLHIHDMNFLGEKSHEHGVKVDADPNALVFRNTASAYLLADVCADCGHVELRVDDPGALYAAYQQSISHRGP
jgi:hypothetical protein